MSKDTDKNLFIVSSMPRLYQHLFRGIASFEELGNRIITQIKAAHAFRQTDKVRELARLLLNFPIKEYRLIAQYYLVWCKCRELNYHDLVLENIAEKSQTYKTQALISRAAFEVYKNEPEAALYFYTEAMNTAPNISEYIGLTLGIAVIKGIGGFHKSAIKDMENLVPLIHHAEPQLFFNFHNSYATELATVGRMSEARDLSRIVMASPFAPFYPEWQETAIELKGHDRSLVAINRMKHHNVLTMPATEHDESKQDIEQTDTTHANLSLDDDNVLEFPRLVDLEKLEKESQEKYDSEMKSFYALIDNNHLHDFVDSILIGDMNPVRFAKFLLRMSKFEDIRMVQDVFHWMLRYTFINSDEFKESETEWTEKLLKEIESTDTL